MRLVIQTNDDESIFLDIRAGETLSAAAKRHGLQWPIDCAEGVCGTCKCRVLAGAVDQGTYTEDALTDSEIAAGYALGCQATAKTDLVTFLRLPAALLRGRKGAPNQVLSAKITRLDAVAKNTLQVTVALESPLDFLPGQYAKLKVPGTDVWRAYSFTSTAGNREVSFLARLLPSGAMSDYLRSASVGDTLELSGPYGVFFMRSPTAPMVMVAGGTGLGPMLSMLQTIAGNDAAPAQPIHLLYGVNEAAEIAVSDLLTSLRARLAGLSVTVSVSQPESAGGVRQGFVTDLLDELDAATIANATFYLCGPPPMIDAGRDKLKALGVPEQRIIYEKFIAAA